MSAIDSLVDAVLQERDRLTQEANNLLIALNAKREQIKQHDRVLNAADRNTKPAEFAKVTTPTKPGRKDSNDWSLSSKKVEQVYEGLVASDQEEFSTTGVEDMLHVSYTTASKALAILHEQGRVRLLGKTGSAKRWAVVR